MSRRKPVVAIGLDAAEPKLLERWMEDGQLPHLAQIRNQGSYGRVTNFENGAVETAWTTFATGVPPEKTGFWNFLKLDGYEYRSVKGYDYDQFPPFYALGDEFRVAAFDIPQVRLHEGINGVQIAGWGAHSAQILEGSRPESLMNEIKAKHGAHPAFKNDFAKCLDIRTTKSLETRFATGISLRSAICRDLIARERWDLFLTVFSEPHSAGHVFWQLSQSDHPLYEAFKDQVDTDPLLATYQQVDRAIGEIVAELPEDTCIILFSDHGMGPATHELPSFVFLPELLYRLSFQGSKRLAEYVGSDATLPAPIASMKFNHWERQIWATQTDRNRFRRMLRRELHPRIFRWVEPMLEPRDPDGLVSPFELVRKGDRDLPWVPSKWYQPLWPRMEAFALPSFADGLVRINLRGRDPRGIVEPDNYDHFCDHLSEQIQTLKDARTGQPLVKQVVRTRTSPLDDDPRLPDADLIVVWQTESAADIVDSNFGRMGPLPFCRAGTHRIEGFIAARGPGIPPGSELNDIHALDLAPTILDQMGASIPDYLPGKPVQFNNGTATQAAIPS